jgi:hypothetical protein
VPATIELTADDSLTTWKAYHSGNGAWTRRGEEIHHPGGKTMQAYYDEDGRYSSAMSEAMPFPESAHFYQRPLAEDGAIEYEFYCNPGKCMVHPMLDRLVFLLDPNGVKLHWLTDGAAERSNRKPLDSIVEADCRRGPDKLPLKEKAWNKLRLQVVDDRVKVALNGIEVYERKIESTNQRLFGLFHYSDQSEARVRALTYVGNWAKQVPAKLFEMKGERGASAP